MVLLYDRTTSLLKVNEARQELFCRKSREFDSIPPTEAALEQHIRLAVLQGPHTWGQTLLCQPALPSPADWRWQRQARRWSPYWTTLKQAKDNCYELIYCGCKTACRRRCKCVHRPLQMWRKLPTAIVKEHSSDKVYICSVYIKPIARYVNLEFVQR